MIPLGNREVVMERLNDWLRGQPPQQEATGSFTLHNKNEGTPSIICVGCEQRKPLWDEMGAVLRQRGDSAGR